MNLTLKNILLKSFCCSLLLVSIVINGYIANAEVILGDELQKNIRTQLKAHTDPIKDRTLLVMKKKAALYALHDLDFDRCYTNQPNSGVKLVSLYKKDTNQPTFFEKELLQKLLKKVKDGKVDPEVTEEMTIGGYNDGEYYQIYIIKKINRSCDLCHHKINKITNALGALSVNIEVEIKTKENIESIW